MAMELPAIRSTKRCCLGDRVTHLPGRSVGDIANWVKVFASRARGYQDRLTAQVALRLQHIAHGRNNIFLSREPPRADHAAGEVALGGVNNSYSARPQHLDIFLGG